MVLNSKKKRGDIYEDISFPAISVYVLERVKFTILSVGIFEKISMVTATVIDALKNDNACCRFIT